MNLYSEEYSTGQQLLKAGISGKRSATDGTSSLLIAYNMLLLFIIVILGAVLLFGPAIAGAFGSLFSWLISGAIIILAAPFINIVTYKDDKECNRLWEEMKKLEHHHGRYSDEYISLRNRYEECEKRKASKAYWVGGTVIVVTFTAIAINMIVNL